MPHLKKKIKTVRHYLLAKQLNIPHLTKTNKHFVIPIVHIVLRCVTKFF